MSPVYMHANTPWRVLLLLVGLITTFFCARATTAYWDYRVHNEPVAAHLIRWDVIEGSWGRYQLQLEFTTASHPEPLSQVLKSESFRNQWAAQTRGEELLKFPSWTVWQIPGQAQSVTLQRFFPWHKLITAAACLALFLYFVALGYYVGNLTREG